MKYSSKTLADALGRYAGPAVRAQAEWLLVQERIEIEEGSESFVRACVHDSKKQEVTLDWGDFDLEASCTCQKYPDDGVCRHIWAVVLAADNQCFLSEAASKGRLLLEGMDDCPDYDEDPESGLEGAPLRTFVFVPESGMEKSSPDNPVGNILDLLAKLAGPAKGIKPAEKAPAWKRVLIDVRARVEAGRVLSKDTEPRPESGRILYMLDLEQTRETGVPLLFLAASRRKKNGEWGIPKRIRSSVESAVGCDSEDADRRILAVLGGATGPSRMGMGWYSGFGSYYLRQQLFDVILPMLCATGRFHAVASEEDIDPRGDPLEFDGGPPWEFRLRMEPNPPKGFLVRGFMARSGESMPLGVPDIILAGGWFISRGKVSRFGDAGVFDWIAILRQHDEIPVPAEDAEEFLAGVLGTQSPPELELPESLEFKKTYPKPLARLMVRSAKRKWEPDLLAAELSFDYAGRVVPCLPRGRGIFDPGTRTLIVRDSEVEQAAWRTLLDLGLRQDANALGARREGMVLKSKILPEVTRSLSAQGWRVEAEGRLYRPAGRFDFEVTSGIDWFELHGMMDFGGVKAALPALLKAIKKGENTVVLGDGSLGMLPEAWLRKWGFLSNLGGEQEDHLRFGRTQTAMLDALLASQPEARFDAAFAKARGEIARFERVVPADPPSSFRGTLRPYQRDGLGWMNFLRGFGFGGCLADDMGLGKTVQVLALLDSIREGHAAAGNAGGGNPAPSLAVVPRSLLFNWRQEAARFAPKLKVFEHSGQFRPKDAGGFRSHDLVLTTYGTLRRDIDFLKDVEFEYAILDEAQAVKNASTDSAKAVRLLKARHRLAMSGTPVENRLGELWSLVEFLNPGMLGSSAAFEAAVGKDGGEDGEARALLARALRPFILRRTKAQVAKDLPARTEQTIFCELPDMQRKQYDELRDHYRNALLSKVDSDGLAKAKMHVLEALLRLRQAACHPGLIDKTRTGESSAKLDALLPQLAEITEEGHKALVFSQFTSLLAIVRDRLDAEKIRYAYLDGRTRDRAACVEEFQCKSDCMLFLISLKAGGLGLNLTAAEYVFLLDPWWNPAVEAQAIDRTHRIGQTKQVFAYRIIAKDTVEEKVLELQKSKRDLADAIINEDNSLIRNLTRADLELLLG